MMSNDDNQHAPPSCTVIKNIISTNPPSSSILQWLWHCFTSITVEPAPFLYAFGVMLYTPVFGYTFMNKLCRQHCHYSLEQCAAFGSTNLSTSNATVDLHVRTVWAQFDSLSTILGTLPSIAFALMVGPWSDIFGRKLPIALPFLGTMLAVAMTSLLLLFDHLPVWMLLLPNLLQSSFGGMASLLTGTFAYAADISPDSGGGGAGDSAKTIRIAVIEVGIVTGFAIGGIVGGVMVAQNVSYDVCYLVAFATAVIGMAYIFIRVRETRHPDRLYSLSETCSKLFSLQNLLAAFQTMTAKRPQKGLRTCMWLLILANVMNSTIFMSEANIMQKYLTAAPLNWTLAFFMTFQSTTLLVGMALATAFIAVAKKILHVRDTTLGIIGCVSRIFWSYGVALATTTTLMCAASVAGVGKYMLPVAIRALMSNLVPRSEQGRMFSLVSSTEAVSPLIGALVVTNIFTSTAAWWPRFFEIVFAFAMLVPLVIFVVVDYYYHHWSSIDYSDQATVMPHIIKSSTVEPLRSVI